MNKLLNALFVSAVLAFPVHAFAQGVPAVATVVNMCGTPPTSYTAGQNRAVLQNTSGQVCNSSAVTSGGINIPVSTNPGLRTIISLDISTVTTGGTAVTALAAGHKTAGGFLLNPSGATIDLCINEQGTAVGAASSGSLTCIKPGQVYTLSPTIGAVSVIASDSAHPFSGYGLN